MTTEPSKPELAAEVEDLRTRLAEAEDVLRAIRSGEVDALVVTGERGEQVYTLTGADRIYRQLIETMSEGAATLSADGDILYCNACLAKTLRRPLDEVLGAALRNYLPPADQEAFDSVLRQARTVPACQEIRLLTSEGRLVPVYLSATLMRSDGAEPVFCLVLTDLTEQKRHEEIVAAERLARSVLEQAAEAIVVCDDQGRVTRAGQAAQRLCPENPLLRLFTEAFPLRSDGPSPFSLAPVLQGETLNHVEVKLERQGQSFVLLLNAGPLLGIQQQRLGCVVTLTDITELKRAAEAVREVKEILDITLKSIGDGVISTDLAGKIVRMNPTAETLTNWALAEAAGRPLTEVFRILNGQTRQPVEDPVGRVLETGRIVGLGNHTVLIARDETERQIADCAAPVRDAAGQVRGVVLIFRDVTREYAAAEALNASEVRYRRLFEAARDGILILDAETGLVVDVNPFLIEMSGFSHEQFLGKRIWELGFFKAIVANQASFAEWRHNEYTRHEDMPLETAHGRRIEVEFVSNVYPVNHHKVIQCNIRDITERKQAEKELRVSREQLRALAARLQAAREEERTSLAREIHDVLAQELARLKIDLAWLHGQLTKPGKAAAPEALAARVSAMSRLADEAIHSVQRIATGLRPAVLDSLGLCAAVEWQARDFQAHTRIPCHANVPEEEQPVDRDSATAVFRILQESLTNVQRHAQATRVDILLRQEANQLVLRVQDNGCGIRSETLSSPLSIGLTGMRERALLLGGQFSIRSQPGSGTTIEVRLPLSKNESLPAGES